MIVVGLLKFVGFTFVFLFYSVVYFREGYLSFLRPGRGLCFVYELRMALDETFRCIPRLIISLRRVMKNEIHYLLVRWRGES